MRRALRRTFGYVLPSLVAAAAAVIASGLIEGARSTTNMLATFASAGFVAMLAMPAVFAGGLVLRAVWRAWRPAELAAAAIEDTGGAPRLAAWLTYAFIGAWFTYAFTFNAVRLLSHSSSSRDVVALASALLVAGCGVGLAALSRPAVDAFAWALRRLDRAVYRRWQRSPLRPGWIAGYAVAALIACIAIGWYASVKPRIGMLDLTPAMYLGITVVVATLVTWAWGWLVRRPVVAAAVSMVAVGGVGLAIAAALHVRSAAPYTMLEVWGDAPLAGAAVDAIYDIESLRGELRLVEFKPTARPGAPHPDVVLVTIDTLRADRTPLHNGPAPMPNLETVGAAGAVFRWAFAPGNVTRRSLPTIATGLSPFRVRGRVAGWALRLDPRHVLLAERFRAAGYDTAGFFCCGSQFADRHRLGLIRGLDTVEIQYDGAALSELAAGWIRARREAGATRPLFLWVHYIEPHRWEELYPRADHGGDVRQRYDMVLTDVDRMLGTLLAEAWPSDRRDRTILAVTSDHGEGLGDRGQRFHSTNLHNSQIRVPFVIAAPGVRARRIDRVAGLVSVAPTLLDLAGFEPPGMPHMDGPSLAPLLRDDEIDTDDEGLAFSAMIKDRSVDNEQRAVIAGRYKLIERDHGRVHELYDLAKDSTERLNLARELPEVLAELERKLAAEKEREAVSPF